MMRIASTVVIVVAGCGGGGPDNSQVDQRAQEAFFADYSASVDIQQQALAATPARVADVVKTLDFSAPCATAGTAMVTGAYDDGDGNGAAVTFSLDVVFDGCDESAATIDGTEHWVKVVDPSTDDVEMIDTNIAYVTPEFSGLFELHVTIRVDASAGTAEYTGTYVVDGTTYTIDKSVWGAGF